MDTEHYTTGTCKHGRLYLNGCASCEDEHEDRKRIMPSERDKAAWASGEREKNQWELGKIQRFKAKWERLHP